MWVRLVLLFELSGRLDTEAVVPDTEKEPPIRKLSEAGEGRPRRDAVALVEGRVVEDNAESGRLRSVEAAVCGLLIV